MKFHQYVENCLIVASIVLTIASSFYDSVGLAAFLLDCMFMVDLLYTKIPPALDRYFQTKVFKKDQTVRIGLTAFPTTMFLLFDFSVPFGFMFFPSSLRSLVVLDTAFFFFGATALIFLSILYFSWRIRACLDQRLIEKLWRKACESDEDYQNDRMLYKRSRFDRILTNLVATGIVPTAISVMLFISWLVLAVIDVAFVMLLMLLLTYNLLHEIERRSIGLKERERLAYRLFNRLDSILTWDAILQTGLNLRVGGFIEALMLIVSLLLLIFLSFLSFAAFIVMFGLLCQWYVLIVLVQIGRRSRLKHGKKNLDAKLRTLPPGSNLILPSCLIMLISFTALGSYYSNIQKSTVELLLLLSAILNIGAVASIILWRGKRNKGVMSNPEDKSVEKDEYRLYCILCSLGLPVVFAGKNVQGYVFWTVFTGALIWLNFDARFRQRLKNAGPIKYATTTTLYEAVGVSLIIGLIFYMIAKLSLVGLTVASIVGFLLISMWVQKFRTRNTIKEQPDKKAI